jgi:hypothetical protein
MSYITAKVKLPVGGHTFANAKVIGGKNECGELIGKSSNNPMMDTSVYEVKLTKMGPHCLIFKRLWATRQMLIC